jgi:alkylation response protein AidB-like acyl-CoA dehydrogenase
MNSVVFGATLSDDEFVYVWSPGRRSDFGALFNFDDVDSEQWGSLAASAPIPLCAMNASATVELRLNGWFVPEEHYLQSSTRSRMESNDRNGVLGATAMPLGCAKAGVRILREIVEQKPLPAIKRASDSFTSELEDARSEVEHWSDRSGEENFFENGVRLRAWCIELALRTAHAAVAAVSGSANSLNHPAQRLLREAMFYTIQAQTRDVMSATLNRLVSRRG